MKNFNLKIGDKLLYDDGDGYKFISVVEEFRETEIVARHEKGMEMRLDPKDLVNGKLRKV